MTRRQFVGNGFRTFSALALSASFAGGMSSVLAGCGSDSAQEQAGSVPPATDIPNQPSGQYTFSFSQFSALAAQGGSVHVRVAATSGPKDLYVTRVSDSSVIAVTTTCTHEQCTIGVFNGSIQKYTCPCHGSQFNADGSVDNGPANAALQAYSGTPTSSEVVLAIA